MKKYVDKFQYLSQDLPDFTHAEQTEMACQAGANWVQYRCLTKCDEELLEEINHVAAICDDWGATLILTNHYHLLHLVDAQGVHLEDMESDFAAIRQIISEEKTLGASAHSFEDIRRIDQSGAVDYIGCGPFGFTQTKPNNFSLLAVEGYREIVEQMRQQQIDIPLLAVGGIKVENVPDLLATGIYGVAVSSAVNLAANPADALDSFRKLLV